MPESCKNESKRLRSLSDSDMQSTSSKFVISEEEWLVVLGRLKDLESKRDSDSARIEELQQQLSTVKEENLRLKLERSSYNDSLEFTQKEYDRSKGRISQVCIRIMTFSEPQSHSEPLSRSLNLLKFTDLITFQILNFIHKWAHNLLPPSFNHFFQSTSSAHKCSTRQSTSGNLFLKCVRTTQYGLRSLQFLGPKLWNSLPLNIRDTKSHNSFCNLLFKHLIDKLDNC